MLDDTFVMYGVGKYFLKKAAEAQLMTNLNMSKIADFCLMLDSIKWIDSWQTWEFIYNV